MEKKKKAIIGLIIIYLVLFLGVGMLILKPGLKELKRANNIKIYTEEEIVKEVAKIEEEGKKKRDEINQKYSVKREEINGEYKTKEEEIKTKYNNLKTEIDKKYEDKIKELNNKKNDLSVKQNKEFFANGFSKEYYKLRDQETEMFNKISELDRNKNEEIRNNDSEKEKEIKELERKKSLELTEVDTKISDETGTVNNKVSEDTRIIKEAEEVKNSYIKEFIKYLVIGIVILLLPVIYIVVVYNELVKSLNLVKEKWSQVDVFLKQRVDLIPNIVSSVKGYVKHEKETFEDISKARTKAMKATTKEDEINANRQLEKDVNKIFLLREAYPELKANENFEVLQNDLRDIEDNISVARQLYNRAVLKYKNKMETFPSNIIAGLFNFKEELFFEIDDNDKENVEVKF